MRNLNKTVAAGVLGLALLAGTAGTFATWQHQATANVGTISTGDLEVKSVTLDPRLGRFEKQNVDGTWTTINRDRISTWTFVPGTRWESPVYSEIGLSGLTMSDIDLSTSWADHLEFTEDGFLILNEQPTQIQFTIINNRDDNHNLASTIRVEFVRDRVNAPHMYDNNINAFQLGDLTVTATQK